MGIYCHRARPQTEAACMDSAPVAREFDPHTCPYPDTHVADAGTALASSWDPGRGTE
jgi:hypothetical protein